MVNTIKKTKRLNVTDFEKYQPTVFVVSRDDEIFGVFSSEVKAKAEQKKQSWHRGMRGSIDERVYISKSKLI